MIWMFLVKLYDNDPGRTGLYTGTFVYNSLSMFVGYMQQYSD